MSSNREEVVSIWIYVLLVISVVIAVYGIVSNDIVVLVLSYVLVVTDFTIRLVKWIRKKQEM